MKLWPTRRLISSIAIPLSDSREAKVWRSSRGVHCSSRPALLRMVRSDRRTSAASSRVASGRYWDRTSDLLGVNEWQGGQCWSLVQVAGLRWS
jgi:hypothetical protein